MPDLVHRLACLILLVAGLGTVATTGAVGTAEPIAAVSQWHRELMVLLVGGALALAAFVAPLRLPAIAAALLAKGAFLVAALFAWAPWVQASVVAELTSVLFLFGAGFVFFQEFRLESRWNSALPSRQEA